ncbi:MAG: class I SAM-dependent methyltransferase [Gammaproteobacteria bacterium]|nr:class I SAM-dependent methyltransferase [Gammaproteobacteria bacterium]MBU2676234.1 class I SAM-dependent methyltransferase [Gammaproteobacteria bacterium]NNC55931.1 methyltransferase domain-containing protein [Woeseiaceae bacterium]NNL49970.1 methyltransferase domain-containing protein [Woeseiaceae bacterium]
MASMCRFCGVPLEHEFVNLGLSPISNAFVNPNQANEKEPLYPLHAFVCSECFLVQLEEFQSPDEIFSDYVYFSSYSDSWLAHAKRFVESAAERFKLDSDSLVMEVASNDGYLLQYFVERGVPVLGIEPASNVAEVARRAGVETIDEFFGVALAKRLRDNGRTCDLLVGNNVLAHVPDINDFVGGLKIVLGKNGVLSMEFPHLLKLIQQTQFDTIYHEHFSYLSLISVQRIFRHHGLEVFDVEELKTHGGSLRVFAQHPDGKQATTGAVERVLNDERQASLDSLSGYQNFAERVAKVKDDLLAFLEAARSDGKSVVGYGAPAKGNTLLNFCGIGPDSIQYTVDRSPYKQDHLLPGTHIPVHAPEHIAVTKPDYVLILPWNLQDEIVQQMSHIKDWGGQCVVPIPELRILE